MNRKPDPELIDEDNPEWTEEEIRNAIPFSALPESLRTKLSTMKHGRPKAEGTKERITIRLSRDVVERFRATGDGWQTRIDSALREWLEAHPRA